MEWKGPLRYNRLFPVPYSTLYIANSFNAWMPPKNLTLNSVFLLGSFLCLFRITDALAHDSYVHTIFISILPCFIFQPTNSARLLYYSVASPLKGFNVKVISSYWLWEFYHPKRIKIPISKRRKKVLSQNEWSRVEYVVIFSLLTHNFLFDKLASGHN